MPQASLQAQSLRPLAKDSKPRAVTLPQMYAYAFRIANNLQSQSAAGKQPAALSWNDLTAHLGLTENQAAAFRNAAQRFAPADRQITRRILALAAADRAKHPKTRTLSEDAGRRIEELVELRLSAAASELDLLHRSLSAEAARQVDDGVAALYSEPRSSQPSANLSAAKFEATKSENHPHANAIENPIDGDPVDGDDPIETCDDSGGFYDLSNGDCVYNGGDGGGGSSVPTTVTFSPLSSVAQGGTATVAVTVTTSDGFTITLSLRAVSGTGAAQFLSGGTIAPGGESMTITQSGSIVIGGVAASSVANNIRLDATVSLGDGLGTLSVASPGPLLFSVTPPPPTITSISPSEIAVGASNVNVTISGSGFGTSPTVNLPSGVTLSNQSATDSNIALAVTVGYVTPSTSAQITVTSAGGTSKPSKITLNGPAWAVVLGDTTGQDLEGTILRLVSYQVYNVDGTEVASIPIAEQFTASGWSCTNAPQPVRETTTCNGQDHTESSGQFTDTWSYFGTYFTPANCGVSVTDHWQWCSPSGPSSGITFMTLSGFIHTVDSEINGFTSPPGEIPAGTIFKP